MRVEVFLDDETEPLAIVEPPGRFEFDSTRVADGAHRLRFRACDERGAKGERIVRVQVRNGPAIAVHGVKDGEQLTGRVPMLINAYGARVGDAFEPERIETPAPVPTWAWVLCLAILGWGVGYVSLEVTGSAAPAYSTAGAVRQDAAGAGSPAPAGGAVGDVASGDTALGDTALGAQIYGNHCASCHQLSGDGLPGVFPPLRGNPAVLADNPAEHIDAVLHGVSGKTIDGISYPAPMPPFGAHLTDREIAAVVNHERTEWGNGARTVSVDDVAARR